MGAEWLPWQPPSWNSHAFMLALPPPENSRVFPVSWDTVVESDLTLELCLSAVSTVVRPTDTLSRDVQSRTHTHVQLHTKVHCNISSSVSVLFAFGAREACYFREVAALQR